MRTPNLSNATALVALTGALALPAAAAQKSDAEIRRDIEFARGLAADWSFVDLSEAVLRGIEDGGVSNRMETELALVKCEIFAIGAENSRDATERNRLYEEALTAYESFLRDYAQTVMRSQAEAGFVDVSAKYARSLARAVENATGAEAETLRLRQEDVLSAAVTKTGDLIANLKSLKDRDELSEAQKRDLYELMLNRARMLLEVAKTQEDGAFNFEQSRATYEDLVFTAGEGTLYALRAYVGIGDIEAARQDWEEAAIFFEQVVDLAIPIERELWDEKREELTPGQLELHWLFVQLGTPGLVDALSNYGDTAGAMRWGLHFYNTQRREGFSFQPGIGYMGLLAVARALLDSGGWVGGSLSGGEAQWYATLSEAEADGHRARSLKPAVDVALQIAEKINQDNPRNVLKVYAQRLISDAISRPGVRVDPGVLVEAAMGAYHQKEFGEAIDGFKRVLLAIDGQDSTSQLLHAPRVLFYLGTSYYRLDRPLEAAVTFQEGCTRFRGDPEFDTRNAQGFYQAMKQIKAGLSDDEIVQGLIDQAEALVLEIGTPDQGAILYQQADKLRTAKDYAAAIAKYRQVTPDSKDYEKGLTYIGVCEYRKGDAETALATFESYLNDFINDPANATTSPVVLQRRQEAMAVAEFYRGLIHYDRARAGTGEWQPVVDLLTGFVDRYPEQNAMGPFAKRLEVLAYLRMNDTEAARKLFDELVAQFPDSKQTGAAALEFYKTLEPNRKLADEAGDTEKSLAILREMAELTHLGNETDRSPNWGNLERESRHWIELGEYANAEAVLRQRLEFFADDEQRQEGIQKYVLPQLADAVLQQGRAREAYELLAPLFVDENVKPSKALAINYARAVTGWVKGDGEPFEIIPGAGEDEAQFELATTYLIQNANSVEKYSCDWIELKFELAYAYYVWGQKNSRKLDSARAQLGPLEQDYSAGFADVDVTCEEVGALERGVALRRRLNWLRAKLD